MGSKSGVRVLQTAGYLVLLDSGLHLVHEADDGLVLLVGLAQRGLEARVRVQQAGDLLHGVHDEHVHEVLARAVQPVVEGRGALGELQVQQVELLQHALGLVQRGAAPLRERAQPVPLRAHALAARVHRAHLVVLQRAATHSLTSQSEDLT